MHCDINFTYNIGIWTCKTCNRKIIWHGHRHRLLVCLVSCRML